MVKGMLALCPHCGYSSLFFNRCERCNTKIKIDGVKSIPIAERKEAGMSVDVRIMSAMPEDRYILIIVIMRSYYNNLLFD